MIRKKKGKEPYDGRFYCYPESDTLINRLNIRDFDRLMEAERSVSKLRAETVSCVKDRNKTDDRYLRAVHRHLFQDLYYWTGNYRECDIAKEDSRFCRYQEIPDRMSGISNMLKKTSYFRKFRDCGTIKVSENPARCFGDLNYIHPFREGNGRTIRIFLCALAEHAGYELDYAGISREAWMDASVCAFHGEMDPMENLFAGHLRREPLSTPVLKVDFLRKLMESNSKISEKEAETEKDSGFFY